MWILDQVGNISVNTDNVNYISIDTKECSVRALIYQGSTPVKIPLGYYDSVRDCQKVLQILMGRIHTKCAYTEMPRKDAVNVFAVV